MQNKPLTKTQIRAFKRNVMASFDEIYARTVSSGELPEAWAGKNSHLAAKFALIKTADSFNVFSRVSKSEFKHMEHHV